MMDESKLLYSKTHEWIHIQGEICTIGLSRFAVDALTDITYLELPEVGTQIATGEAFGVVESVKSTSDLYASLPGEVIEVNEPVLEDPAILNSDPYEKGWLIRLRIASAADTSDLMDKTAYDDQCAAEEH